MRPRFLLLATAMLLAAPAWGSSNAVKYQPAQSDPKLGCLGAVKICDQWPTNIIAVTDSARDSDCVSLHNPYDECTAVAGVASPSVNGFEGNDIAKALTACQTAGGCAIDLGCNTYVNAELDFTTSTPTAGSGRHGGGYSAGFQKGVDIFGRRAGVGGCGPGTIVRSRLITTLGPAWENSPPTAAIFYFQQWDPPGTPTKGTPRVRIRDLECDGQSDKEPSPEIVGGLFFSAQLAAFHSCVQTRSDAFETRDLMVVQNVWAHHFEGQGISIAGATVQYADFNTVNNIGCWQNYDQVTVCDLVGSPFTSISDTCWGGGTGCRPACTAQFTCATCQTTWKNLTTVTGEIPCGCNSGQANCFGWNVSAETNTPAVGSPGFKTAQNTAAILVGGPGGGSLAYARGNNVSFTSKYGINHAVTAGAETNQDVAYISGNTSSHSSFPFFQGTGSAVTYFTNNVATSAGVNGDLAQAGSCYGSQGRRLYLEVSNNTCSGNVGGVEVKSWKSGNAKSPDLRITNNTFTNLGGWVQIQNSPQELGGVINWAGNLVADAPCAAPELQFTTTAEISRNTMTTGIAGYAGLQLSPASTFVCPANVMNGATIANNTISPTSWAAKVANLTQIHVLGINATGNVLTTGTNVWTWLLGATGTCSGFIKNGNTVTDSSGNGIGSC